MQSKPTNRQQQQFLISTLDEMLDAKQPLYQLANHIDWQALEAAFAPLYSDIGRPAKPIRLMVGLLILKSVENLSDEVVVERWTQNPYYQFLCGEEVFQWEFPCTPSELTHFRNRIGEAGAETIFQSSIDLHPNKAIQETEVVIDTTVQDKNITYPTDSKLHLKIIARCQKLFAKEKIAYRRSYKFTVGKLRMKISKGSQPTRRKEANKAMRQLRTIASRLVRELRRKLSKKAVQRHAEALTLYERVLKQERNDKNKIYSLHEPDVCCYSKGKAHKKYEFGSKVSLTMTKTSGIIVGAMNFSNTMHDGHTLDSVLHQTERLTGVRPAVCIVDGTYRGRKIVGSTEVITTGSSKQKLSRYEKRKRKKRLCRRAAIEPVIGHLKQEHRLGRNFLKGIVGDAINVLMAAAAFNIRKWMRQLLHALSFFSPTALVLAIYFQSLASACFKTRYRRAF